MQKKGNSTGRTRMALDPAMLPPFLGPVIMEIR
jgi:hypothetical protein